MRDIYNLKDIVLHKCGHKAALFADGGRVGGKKEERRDDKRDKGESKEERTQTTCETMCQNKIIKTQNKCKLIKVFNN